MVNALWIFFGGGLGSLARWGASGFIANRIGQTFPWGTLVVNITGSFIIGLFATAAVRQNMGRWDQTRAATTQPAPQTQPTNPTPATFPLARDGRIVCSTCHNPHENGLFPATSVLAAGAMQQETQDHGPALRVSRKDVCRVCHNQ